jgi:hypothetical protein
MSAIIRGAAATAAALLMLGGGTAANAAEGQTSTGNACEVTVEHFAHPLSAALELTCSSLEPGVQARAVATVNTPRNLDDYVISTWEGAWLQAAPGSVETVQEIRFGTIISDLHIQYAPIEP